MEIELMAVTIDRSSLLRDIAPTGALRVAINLGNPVLAQRLNGSGEIIVVSVSLAKALGVELGLPVTFVTFDSAGKVFSAIEDELWDVAFLANEPVRAEKLSFSKPYVIIEGTYLVRQGSEYYDVSDLDPNGVQISVGQGAAYDLFLSRTLRSARLVRASTSALAVDLFLGQNLDAAAGVRQPLERIAQNSIGLRVLKDSFTEINQAIAEPNMRNIAAEYFQDFVEKSA
jgi:polar amino acid transport system substrate-binding protein